MQHHAVDKLDVIKEYLRNQGIFELFEDLTTALIFHQPDDPKLFLINAVDMLRTAEIEGKKTPDLRTAMRSSDYSAPWKQGSNNNNNNRTNEIKPTASRAAVRPMSAKASLGRGTYESYDDDNDDDINQPRRPGVGTAATRAAPVTYQPGRVQAAAASAQPPVAPAAPAATAARPQTPQELPYGAPRVQQQQQQQQVVSAVSSPQTIQQQQQQQQPGKYYDPSLASLPTNSVASNAIPPSRPVAGPATAAAAGAPLGSVGVVDPKTQSLRNKKPTEVELEAELSKELVLPVTRRKQMGAATYALPKHTNTFADIMGSSGASKTDITGTVPALRQANRETLISNAVAPLKRVDYSLEYSGSKIIDENEDMLAYERSVVLVAKSGNLRLEDRDAILHDREAKLSGAAAQNQNAQNQNAQNQPPQKSVTQQIVENSQVANRLNRAAMDAPAQAAFNEADALRALLEEEDLRPLMRKTPGVFSANTTLSATQQAPARATMALTPAFEPETALVRATIAGATAAAAPEQVIMWSDNVSTDGEEEVDEDPSLLEYEYGIDAWLSDKNHATNAGPKRQKKIRVHKTKQRKIVDWGAKKFALNPPPPPGPAGTPVLGYQPQQQQQQYQQQQYQQNQNQYVPQPPGVQRPGNAPLNRGIGGPSGPVPPISSPPQQYQQQQYQQQQYGMSPQATPRSAPGSVQNTPRSQQLAAVGPLCDAFAKKQAQFQKLFSEMDADRNGDVSLVEFLAALKKNANLLGFLPEGPDQLTQTKLFALIDRDNNGVINWDEFCAAISGLSQDVRIDRAGNLADSFLARRNNYRDVFDKLDRNRDGTVSAQEFVMALNSDKNLLGLLGTEGIALNEMEAFKLIDRDGNGRITWDEFQAAMYAIRIEVEKSKRVAIVASYKENGERWRRIFERMDANGDGTVSPVEFSNAIRDNADLLGITPKDATAVATLFDKMDANHDNYISFAEFMAGMARLADEVKKEAEEKLAVAFKARQSHFRKLYDLMPKGGGTGGVPLVDFLAAIKKNADKLGMLVEETGTLNETNLFKKLDKDGNGLVTFDEFFSAMCDLEDTVAKDKADKLAEAFKKRRKEFRRLFDDMDADKSGSLSMIELSRGIKRQAGLLGLAASDVSNLKDFEVFKRLDKDGNGQVSWEEFETGMQMLQDEAAKKNETKLAEGFIKEQDRFQRMFRQLDSNGDGEISTQEFTAGVAKSAEFMELIGADGKKGLETIKIFTAIDKDTSGKISWPEFKAAMVERATKAEREKREKVAEAFKQDEEKFRMAFLRFDTSRDGLVSIEEFKTGLKTKQGNEFLKLLNYDGLKTLASMEIFTRADKSGDGKLSWDEFKGTMLELADQAKRDREAELAKAFTEREQDFVDVFSVFDRDRDGTVTVQEFVRGINSYPEFSKVLGLGGATALKDMPVLRRAFADRVGKLTYNEFRDALRDVQDSARTERQGRLVDVFLKEREELEKEFKRLDLNRDGLVSQQEFLLGVKGNKTLVDLLGPGAELAFKDLSFWAAGDTDKDARLTWEEFNNAMLDLADATAADRIRRIRSAYRRSEANFYKIFTRLEKDSTKKGHISCDAYFTVCKNEAQSLGLKASDIEAFQDMDWFINAPYSRLVTWDAIKEDMTVRGPQAATTSSSSRDIKAQGVKPTMQAAPGGIKRPSSVSRTTPR